MTKIIFLDIDGVLLSNYDLRNTSFIPRNRYIPVDRGFLAAQACIKTGAQVVVSSTWRYDENTAPRLRALFIPLHKDWRTCREWKTGEPQRGYQIDLWLAKHPEVTQYVCLDDDSDFYPYQNLIKINPDVGLEQSHVDQIVELFNGRVL